MKKTLAAAVIALGLAAGLFAREKDKRETYTGSAQLEKIKKLEGKWETPDPLDASESFKVEFEIVAGGSAVMERFLWGTSREMTCVFYDRDGKLAVAYYCMLHNGIEHVLTGANDKEFQFRLSPESRIPSDVRHLHELTMVFLDDDHVNQRWISYMNGRPKAALPIKLSRGGSAGFKVFNAIKKTPKLLMGE